jgi:hypothetical protein
MQQYLKDIEGHSIKFYCTNVKHLFNVMNNSRRKYTFKKGEIKKLRKDLFDVDSTVITDYKTLISLRNMKVNIICNKILIMDCVELSYHLKGMKNARFYNHVDIRSHLRGIYANKTVFLMPPNNIKLFREKYPDLEGQTFFKHINIDMLNTIECENRDGYFYRWNIDIDDDEIKKEFGPDCYSFPPTWTTNAAGVRVPLKYNESDHLFDYKNLIYRRRSYLSYEEQFGRLIFEYILLGKTVYFLNEKHTDDGLTDYLNHFDIHFQGNKITTSKEELTEKMNVYIDKPWEG